MPPMSRSGYLNPGLRRESGGERMRGDPRPDKEKGQARCGAWPGSGEGAAACGRDQLAIGSETFGAHLGRSRIQVARAPMIRKTKITFIGRS